MPVPARGVLYSQAVVGCKNNLRNFNKWISRHESNVRHSEVKAQAG